MFVTERRSLHDGRAGVEPCSQPFERVSEAGNRPEQLSWTLGRRSVVPYIAQ